MLSFSFFTWQKLCIHKHMPVLVSGEDVVNLASVPAKLLSDQMTDRFPEVGVANH